MKSGQALSQEAWTAFLRAHPELAIMAAEPLTAHIINMEKIYAKIAIDHAVAYLIEQIQLEQGGKPTRKR